MQSRVNKTQQKKDIEWRYVPTYENPSDLGSCGGVVTHDEELWWYGRNWLSQLEEWPADITTESTKNHLQKQRVRELFQLATEHQLDEFDELVVRRNYLPVLRVCARVASLDKM